MSHPRRKVGWTPWVELTQFDVCYGIMPKNASSAFYEALRRHYQLPRGVTKGVHIVEACEHLRRVAAPSRNARFVVRHPVERFESLWRSKSRDHHGTIGGHPVRGMAPVELFEYVREHDDPHWRPQAPYVTTLDAEPLLVPVEYFAEQFYNDTGIEMWGINGTEVRPDDPVLPPSLQEELLERYYDDYLLYELAVRRWENHAKTTDK